MRLPWGIVFCTGCAFAQSGIETPSIGAIVDSSGALRQVQGVAGNFWLGPAAVSGVLSAACAERLCLAKTDSTVLSPTGATDAPPGPAIFGLSSDEAVVFFPEVHRFARWRNDILETLDWTVDGEIVSIRSTEIAVRKDGQVSIMQQDGSVVDGLPGASGPVLLLPTGVVFATKSEIILRQNGSEVQFELAGAESITLMGPHYIAIRTEGAIYALRTEPGRENLFLLPGSVP